MIVRVLDTPPPPRKQSGRRIDEALALEMCRRYQAGESLNDLARAYGYTNSNAVHSVFKTRGWKCRPRPRAPVVVVHKGIRYSPDKDGFLRRCKLVEGRHDYIVLHRVIWEEANGPIPAGHMLTFKDRDRTNCQLKNLELVRRGESQRRRALAVKYPEKCCVWCRKPMSPHRNRLHPEALWAFRKRRFCGFACAGKWKRGRHKGSRLAAIAYPPSQPAPDRQQESIELIRQRKQRQGAS